RLVKARTIAHAIIDAYSTASIKERSPEVHLFIEMPPDAVDVNVHPTKAEVRFRDQSLVHEVVRRALMDALGNSGAPQLTLRPETAAPPPFAAPLPNVLAGGAFPNRWVPQPFADGGGVVGGGAGGFGDRASTVGGAGTFSDGAGTIGEARSTTGEGASTTGEGASTKPLIPLGQFRDTFIVAIDDEGIAIIDQHVAHERVLFERVM